MNLRNPRVWIGILSVTAVLAFVFEDLGRTSPGELSAVHAREPALTGFRSCAQCHGGWTGTLTESCLECHEPIAEHIATGAGLHGSLDKERAEQCGTCHSEHHGGAFQLVNRQTFAKAGIDDVASFDHARIGFEMAGEHLELDCTECHQHAESRELPEGEHRYLGLEQTCSKCHQNEHQEAHQGGMVVACAQCHSQESFAEPIALDHDVHLPLDGGHAGLSCTDCHAPDEPHSLAAIGAGRTPAKRTCVDCHESPHVPDFVQGVAKRTGRAANDSCAACHQPQHGSFSAEQLDVTARMHAASGFSLDHPHDHASCSDCHGTRGMPYAERYPGRKPDDCRACHDDPHGGQFDDSPLAQQGCVSCHARDHFEPHTFTLERHAKTALPLTGSHTETECSACHLEPDNGGARVFHNTPSRCEQCHDDAHTGFFDAGALAAPAGENAASANSGTPGANGTCAHCHQTTEFHDKAASTFDHARWTGFEIAGAHAQSQCEACHPRSAEPDRYGRTFGRVREHVDVKPDASMTCAVCHGDPHDGAFDGAHQPRQVDGRAGCARCHTETSFRALRADFDHGSWTGFVLRGAHARQNCSACHEPLASPSTGKRAWSRARGRACADCHDDPHAGQFERIGRTDCRRCHRDGDEFADMSFNHELHSRFQLGAAHSSLGVLSLPQTTRSRRNRALQADRPALLDLSRFAP